jgi:hypothetical protein
MARNAYLPAMFKAFEFCLPTLGKSVPAGLEWFHEIKYDGYRLRIERDGERVRLITRGCYDWSKRYPWIVEAAIKNRTKRFVIDGEAVVLALDGMPDFNALHSGNQMPRCSSAPSMFWRLMERISATCRSRCARPTLSDSSGTGQMASSSIHSRAARSVPIYSALPATWGWRGWCRSAAIGPIEAGGRRIGSR